MKKLFISQVSDTPTGFEKRTPTKKEILGNFIILLAESLDDSLHLLEKYKNSVNGIIITKGKESSHSKIGKQLWHLIIQNNFTGDLKQTILCFLDMTYENQLELDEFETQKIELNRIRESLRAMRNGYDKTVKRLSNKSKEINDLFERSMAGIFRTDINGKIILGNPIILRKLGYDSIDELNKVGMYSLYRNPSDRKKILKLLKNGVVNDFETELTKKDGNIINVLVNTFPVLDNDNNIVYIEGNLTDITKLKSVEEAHKKAQFSLIEAETRYKTLIESSEDAIFLLKDGAFIELNQKTLDIFKCSYEDIIDKTPVDFSPKFQSDGQLSIDKAMNFIKVTLSGKPQFFEWQHIKLDGTVFNTEVSLNLINLPTGSYVQAIVRDISKRKKIEDALKKSALNYKEIFNTSSDAIFIHDFESGKVLDVNNAMLKMYGYKKHEVIDKTIGFFSEGIAPYDNENALAMTKMAAKKGQQIFEWYARRKDGSLFWAEVNLKLSVIGEEKRFLASVRDIDKRKKAETALMRAQNYITNIIDAMPSVLIGVDNKCKVYQWNSEAEKLSGFSSKKAVGKPLLKMFPSLTDEIKNIKQAINTGKKQININKITEINGEVIYQEIAIYPIRVKDLKGAVIRIDDVTQKREFDERLSHIKKMDAIGQLAGGVAHDFNNLLSGIMGAAEVLKHPKRKLSDKNLKMVDMILHTSKRASGLVSKLLAFGRKGKITSKIIDINDIIDETISILKRTIDKKIELVVNKEAVEYKVIGDSLELENSFLNLGINASHAMPDGGVLSFITKNIDIDEHYCNSSTFEIKAGTYISVEIIDTGKGIKAENIGKIFDPFYTTKEQGKGTGLGLSAVYGTIQDHNGEIRVFSEVEKGTRFEILLPITKERVKRKTKDNRIIKGAGKILFVDDEEIIRNTGKIIIEEMGYKVMVAKDGKEALKLYKAHFNEIDLVITDMIMPKMNGRELFSEIRKINEFCKIALASGYSENKDLNVIAEDNLSAYIKKPFKSSKLSKVIYDLLNK